MDCLGDSDSSQELSAVMFSGYCGELPLLDPDTLWFGVLSPNHLEHGGCDDVVVCEASFPIEEPPQSSQLDKQDLRRSCRKRPAPNIAIDAPTTSRAPSPKVRLSRNRESRASRPRSGNSPGRPSELENGRKLPKYEAQKRSRERSQSRAEDVQKSVLVLETRLRKQDFDLDALYKEQQEAVKESEKSKKGFYVDLVHQDLMKNYRTKNWTPGDYELLTSGRRKMKKSCPDEDDGLTQEERDRQGAKVDSTTARLKKKADEIVYQTKLDFLTKLAEQKSSKSLKSAVILGKETEINSDR